MTGESGDLSLDLQVPVFVFILTRHFDIHLAFISLNPTLTQLEMFQTSNLVKFTQQLQGPSIGSRPISNYKIDSIY